MLSISRELILRAQDGDLEAFKAIYDYYSGFVYNISIGMTRKKEDAEEIAQDVFLKVYRSLKSFEFNASLKTWIYRITVNTAINYCKKKTREINMVFPYEDIEMLPVAEDRGKNEINDEYNKALVRSFLDMLNPDQRACIILRNIEGLSYQEIAKTLNVNINTVRTRLKRARERIMNIYRKRGDKNEVRQGA